MGLAGHHCECRPLIFAGFALLAILVGGIVEIHPAVAVKEAVPLKENAIPYSALELTGRDVYIKEGCYYCHTQMIRPLVAETLRYGAYSEAWESMYDHPFQWGSKRTGPDLARVGGKYPDIWHYKHMLDPRATSQGSIMPNYSFLLTQKIHLPNVSKKLQAMQSLGVPYNAEAIAQAQNSYQTQAQKIVQSLKESGVEAPWDSELVALIGYLQKLGTDHKKVGMQ